MERAAAISAAVVVAAGLAATFYLVSGGRGSGADIFAQCRASRVAGGASSVGGAFELVDETGAAVTDRQVLARPALVYFGYTYCPDVCPLDNARNAEAVDLLEQQGKAVTPVFITVDPARDTPPVMAEYTDVIHPRMVGLTGTDEQVRAASQVFKSYYRKQDSDDAYYLMDHSTFTYLMLPGTGFAEFFPRQATAEQVAERTGCFLDAAASI